MLPPIITDREGLLGALGHGHSWWFDPTQVTYDRQRSEAQIPFVHNRKGKRHVDPPKTTDVLKITDAAGLSSEQPSGYQQLCDVRMTGSSVQLLSAAGQVLAFTVGKKCKIILREDSEAISQIDSESIGVGMPTGSASTLAYPKIVIDAWGLGALIHDRDFDSDELTFDEEAQRVRVYIFEHARGTRRGQKLLEVTGVLNVSIDDKAMIGGGMLCGVEMSASSLKLVGCGPTNVLFTLGEGCRVFLLHAAADEGREWGRYESTPDLCLPPILDIAGAFDSLARRLRLKRPPAA